LFFATFLLNESPIFTRVQYSRPTNNSKRSGAICSVSLAQNCAIFFRAKFCILSVQHGGEPLRTEAQPYSRLLTPIGIAIFDLSGLVTFERSEGKICRSGCGVSSTRRIEWDYFRWFWWPWNRPHFIYIQQLLKSNNLFGILLSQFDKIWQFGRNFIVCKKLWQVNIKAKMLAFGMYSVLLIIVWYMTIFTKFYNLDKIL